MTKTKKNTTPKHETRTGGFKVRTSLRVGIDTVPLPERTLRTYSRLAIGTWPTPE